MSIGGVCSSCSVVCACSLRAPSTSSSEVVRSSARTGREATSAGRRDAGSAGASIRIDSISSRARGRTSANPASETLTPATSISTRSETLTVSSSSSALARGANARERGRGRTRAAIDDLDDDVDDATTRERRRRRADDATRAVAGTTRAAAAAEDAIVVVAACEGGATSACGDAVARVRRFERSTYGAVPTDNLVSWHPRPRRLHASTSLSRRLPSRVDHGTRSRRARLQVHPPPEHERVRVRRQRVVRPSRAHRRPKRIQPRTRQSSDGGGIRNVNRRAAARRRRRRRLAVDALQRGER
eukprot:31385-Pelagococcus_subviridis.AAC.10